MWTNHIQFWDDYVDPMKVTFDGERKLVIVNPQYSTGVRIKQDLYSASKRWLARRQNSAYAAPMRTIGGDSLGGGQYAGDIYFLTNGWRVLIDHQVRITGILYQDTPGLEPYQVIAGGVISTVSAQAFAYSTTGVTVPSAQQVATEVWSTATGILNTSGTIGATIVNTGQTVANVKVNTDNILALSV